MMHALCHMDHSALCARYAWRNTLEFRNSFELQVNYKHNFVSQHLHDKNVKQLNENYVHDLLRIIITINTIISQRLNFHTLLLSLNIIITLTYILYIQTIT